MIIYVKKHVKTMIYFTNLYPPIFSPSSISIHLHHPPLPRRNVVTTVATTALFDLDRGLRLRDRRERRERDRGGDFRRLRERRGGSGVRRGERPETFGASNGVSLSKKGNKNGGSTGKQISNNDDTKKRKTCEIWFKSTMMLISACTS